MNGTGRRGNRPPPQWLGQGERRRPRSDDDSRQPRKLEERSDSRDDLAYGINSVMELVRNKPALIHELVIEKGKMGKRIQDLIDLARGCGLKVHFAGEEAFSKVRGLNHQGVMARIGCVPAIALEEVLATLPGEAPAFLLALDSVQDPHNLGAIARSAAAAGVQAILVPKDRSAPLSGTVLKVSAGGVAHVGICLVTNLVEALKGLKKKGVWIYGAAADSSQSLFTSDLTSPLCLVIGNEGTGLRPLVREQCDFLLSIPMPGAIASLNAASAASVLLFEVVRQRLGGKG